jgi:hypothetical protein
MAEAFVRTLKRDYVRVSPVPDAEAVLRQLDEVHPHHALGYRSPREFVARSPQRAWPGIKGNNTHSIIRRWIRLRSQPYPRYHGA